jgi:SSS family solute:Na+ symporter
MSPVPLPLADLWNAGAILAQAPGGADAGEAGWSRLTAIDVAVIAVYALGIVALGVWAGVKHSRSGGEARGYFLAGGRLRWPVIGMALFATNISCVHLVSLAQTGFEKGLLDGNYEWMAAFTLLLLGLFFAPFYIRSGVATLPDFLEKRYDRASRDWLVVLSLVSAVLVHIGFSFLTGGIVLRDLFGIDLYTSIVVVAVLTALYTAIGGLLAVVLTEAIQTVVLITGAVLITAFAWHAMGGWEGMVAVLEQKNEMHKLSMLRAADEPGSLPWYAVWLGYPIIGIWYWCADQTIVQRVLGARDENHARVGAIFAGLIKILPVFIFVLPGLMAYTLYQSGQLDLSMLMETTPEGGQALNSKGIYTAMITQLLPAGLTGVMVAALLAALMSTVAGALNSMATLFAYDLYRRARPASSDHELVWVGRVTAVAAVGLAIALVPVLNSYENLFRGINDVISRVAPPITCVFLVGVFWRGASAMSAKLTLWLGSALGAGVYALQTLGSETRAAHWLDAASGGAFLLVAFYLFLVCVAMQVVFSAIWPAGAREQTSGLTWATPLAPLKDRGWPGLGDYRVLAAALLVIMVVLYGVFR